MSLAATIRPADFAVLDDESAPDRLAKWLRANPRHNTGTAPFTLLDGVENANANALVAAQARFAAFGGTA